MLNAIQVNLLYYHPECQSLILLEQLTVNCSQCEGEARMLITVTRDNSS